MRWRKRVEVIVVAVVLMVALVIGLVLGGTIGFLGGRTFPQSSRIPRPQIAEKRVIITDRSAASPQLVLANTRAKHFRQIKLGRSSDCRLYNMSPVSMRESPEDQEVMWESEAVSKKYQRLNEIWYLDLETLTYWLTGRDLTER